MTVLAEFWERLAGVTLFTLLAEGRGEGEVSVAREGPHTLIFHEKGVWEREGIAFTNTLRWTWDLQTQTLSLEHLRRGPHRPTFLFHLAPSGPHSLTSIAPHLCAKDAYFGALHLAPEHLHLRWRIIGPNKEEEINGYYTSATSPACVKAAPSFL